MIMKASSTNNFAYLVLIGILSIAIPVVVALLFYLPQTGKLGDLDVSILPHFNAVLNSSTAIALIVGYYFIKQGKRKEHIASMVSAFTLSSLFLISYVIYHYQGTHTLFGDLNSDGILSDIEKESIGGMRTIYLVVLLTHILLAAIIVPFVLLSVYFGITKQYASHRKVSKWTFPLWLYVAISGVIVYLLISPYYH
jgi:putative membrane protein